MRRWITEFSYPFINLLKQVCLTARFLFITKQRVTLFFTQIWMPLQRLHEMPTLLLKNIGITLYWTYNTYQSQTIKVSSLFLEEVNQIHVGSNRVSMRILCKCFKTSVQYKIDQQHTKHSFKQRKSIALTVKL
jgi:hypothetical protein